MGYDHIGWTALYAVYRDATPTNRARLVVQDRIQAALERALERLREQG